MEVFTILYTPILRITIICATVFLTEHGNIIIIIIIIMHCNLWVGFCVGCNGNQVVKDCGHKQARYPGYSGVVNQFSVFLFEAHTQKFSFGRGVGEGAEPEVMFDFKNCVSNITS